MSHWPNYREYGNLDSRSICQIFNDTAVAQTDPEAITHIGDNDNENYDHEGNIIEVSQQTKTVCCVIEKDFNEGYKKLGSGDYGNAGQAVDNFRKNYTKPMASSIRNETDSIRLKNHLEWKRQKEIEYMKKKEAERLEEQKKKEEKLREEKERRRKEKEREEKVREWQEQKAREKEERKREEMVLKALEHEIKGVTQTLDKEKLIHEWMRLKNHQKQLEAERKAELRRKEEETRALRQSLAQISYRQWKERTKSRKIALPKNGYQIFGPKPIPVVKEDWNHDFAKGDQQDKGISARTPKSVSMTSIRGPCPSRTESLLFNDLKSKTSSSCHLKLTRSKTSANDFEGTWMTNPRDEVAFKGPLRFSELNRAENTIPRHEDHCKNRVVFDEPIKPGKVKAKIYQKNLTRNNSDLGYSLGEIPLHLQVPKLPNGFGLNIPLKCNDKLFSRPTIDMLPTKSKLDIYLHTSDSNGHTEEETHEKQKKSKMKTTSDNNLRNYLEGRTLNPVSSKLLIDLNEKFSSGHLHMRNHTTPLRTKPRPACRGRDVSVVDVLEQANTPSRRSRSYDKPSLKVSLTDRNDNRSSSMTPAGKARRTIRPEKSSTIAAKNNTEPVKKTRKPSIRKKVAGAGEPEIVTEKVPKNIKPESEVKNRKKSKKVQKGEYIALMDSPYYSRKTRSKVKTLARTKKDDKEVGQTRQEERKE